MDLDGEGALYPLLLRAGAATPPIDPWQLQHLKSSLMRGATVAWETWKEGKLGKEQGEDWARGFSS